MSTTWMVNQLQSLAENRQNKAKRYNPHPPGVLQEGGTSAIVLDFLKINQPRLFTAGQLIHAVGRSHAAVSFALLYLRSQGLICSTERCDRRNTRYLKYRYNTNYKSVSEAEK